MTSSAADDDPQDSSQTRKRTEMFVRDKSKMKVKKVSFVVKDKSKMKVKKVSF